MPLTPSPDNPPTEVSHLDQLVAEMSARVQAGQAIDLTALTADCPEHREQLEMLLPTLQAVIDLEQSFNHEASRELKSPAQREPELRGVLGDFHLIRELGRGGMGVVYEAEQLSIGRTVALKVLPFASMLDERRLAHFRNEVRAAGQLHHTNIVPVHAVGTDRGVHFFAMQLVDGQSVAGIIAEMRGDRGDVRQPGLVRDAARPLSCAETERAALSTLRTSDGGEFIRTVAQLGVHAAEALEHAHAAGVVHRDVKPSNLLVDSRGKLWLTDFGLARIESDGNLTMTGDVLGTVRYMSPEQTRGSAVVLDHRTDVYSLGATLYELLTLEPPFDAEDRQELLRRINDEEPQALRRLNAAIPQDVETIVLKAMSKDAAGRYLTAQGMADDLRRFLEHKPIEARRPTLLERGIKWSRRHVALVALCAGTLGVVTVACLGAALLTLRAYKSESLHRVAAEDNLQLAATAINRVLGRAAKANYADGDLKDAEKLAVDATEFYEELLKHSNDPQLRFSAARAYGDVADIWSFIGTYEKALEAQQRGLKLLRALVGEFPDRDEYLAARAYAHANVGELQMHLRYFGGVQFGFASGLAAVDEEEPWRQAAADFQHLVNRFPQDPLHQVGLAAAYGGLANLLVFTGRLQEADEKYRQADQILSDLPVNQRTLPEMLTRRAGVLSNWAMLLREQGESDRAAALVEQAIALQKESLRLWPSNPLANYFLYKQLANSAEIHIRVGRHAMAADTVESVLKFFPEQVSTYQLGATLLVRCAALAANDDNLTGEQRSARADAYRRRAQELVAQGIDANVGTPRSYDEFAWMLLTHEDESLRNPARALELAEWAVRGAPERSGPWTTLALAQYRAGEWQVAKESLTRSLRLAAGEQASAHQLALLAMVHAQHGQLTEAREFHARASNPIGLFVLGDAVASSLVKESTELIETLQKESAHAAPEK